LTSTTADKLLTLDAPFLVPDNIGAVRLIVTHDHRFVGITVGAFMHNSPTKVGARIAGGCANMSFDDKVDMIEFFVELFRGFAGFVSSGGTRQESDGKIDPMVTDVPAALAAAYGDQVVTLSTTPRTGEMSLVDDSRLVLDAGSGILPQPGVHMLIVVQPEFSHEVSGWDGDVDAYFALFNEYVKQAGWQFMMPVWNGGGLTRQEAVKAANLGWLVLPVKGSGRAAQDLIDEINAGSVEGVKPESQANFLVVDRDNPAAGRQELVKRGLIAQT
jgi:hypothetical protein